MDLAITYIGGPTALIEWRGLRLLTDPTFDPADGESEGAPSTLRKLTGPALMPEALGRIDAVLLSHEHHRDNLDHAGRAMLSQAGKVFTTKAGAARLGGNAVGLSTWENWQLPRPDGSRIQVTATPARHGPEGGDRGPVVGFALQPMAGKSEDSEAIYVSGDTVWFDPLKEIAERFRVKAALLFLGAATVPAVGPDRLTMNAEDAIRAAKAFAHAAIVPLHYEGWAHFTQGRDAIAAAFQEAGLEHRLRWPQAGIATRLSI